MNCPDCSFENPEAAQFCNSDGRGLARPCPKCGTENPIGANYSGHCGQPLTTAKVAARAKPFGWPQDRLLQFIPNELLTKLEAAQAGHNMSGELSALKAPQGVKGYPF